MSSFGRWQNLRTDIIKNKNSMSGFHLAKRAVDYGYAVMAPNSATFSHKI